MAATIGDRIKAARQRLGMTQPELARACGWESQGRVSNYERGLREPRGVDRRSLAKALGVGEAALLGVGFDMAMEKMPAVQHDYHGSSVEPAPQYKGLCPEISWVKAGTWTEICDVEVDPDATTWHPCPTGASEHTFVLRVVGESMHPEYQPGTLIYVDPERSAETGRDVIAVMTETGEATFKRFIEEPGHGRMLKALNPNWHEPYIPINGNCRVIGVVIADMRLR